jgi:ectoine hydroxylase-related dioxygenase (phytanoyl-CoA dioxygenase family)
LNLTTALTPQQVEELVQHNAELSEAQKSYGLQGHQQDDIYRKVAHHPAISDPVAQLRRRARNRPDHVHEQSDQRQRGHGVHQDSHYIGNDPNPLMACWIAMSDTDKEMAACAWCRAVIWETLRASPKR